MKLNDWIRTTQEYKNAAVTFAADKEREHNWNRDFRKKLVLRLDVVLQKIYPYTTYREKGPSMEYYEARYRPLHEGTGEINFEEEESTTKVLFWGDLSDDEIKFLDLILEIIPDREKFELALRDQWEKFDYDDRLRLLEAICSIIPIDRWELDDEDFENIEHRLLHPLVYRCRQYISELNNMSWEDQIKFENKEDEIELKKAERELGKIRKFFSKYEFHPKSIEEAVEETIIARKKADSEREKQQRELAGQENHSQEP